MLIGNKLHMKRVIDHVRGTVILHNFMIGEPYEEEWLVHEGDDDLDPEGSSVSSNEPDNRRRQELLYYLSELEETPIN